MNGGSTYLLIDSGSRIAGNGFSTSLMGIIQNIIGTYFDGSEIDIEDI